MMGVIMKTEPIALLLEHAITVRASLFDERHETAMRLFNGFTEGQPHLVVDLYGKTIVLHNYADQPSNGLAAVQSARDFLPTRLPWIQAIIVNFSISLEYHPSLRPVAIREFNVTQSRLIRRWY